MKINYYIRYRNPLGHFVEDFVTDSELNKLFRLGKINRSDYKIRGNFWSGFHYLSSLYIDFVYNVI